MRVIRGCAVLLLGVAVVAGPPAAALLWLAGHSLQWPTAGQARAWLADPLTPHTVLVGVAAAAGLLWALVAWLVLVDAARRIRATLRLVQRMPVPTPAQATAGSMAGVAVFGVPATTVTAAAPWDAPTPPAPATMHGPGHRMAPDTAEVPVVVAGGVDLPDGGWMPWPTAHAVASAAALVWLRRRRGYHPTPGRRHNDTDQPIGLPATVTAVQAATAEHRAPADPALLLIDRLPTGGMGLTGPGALRAARGLLITVLLHPADHRPPVVTTRADMVRLVGRAATGMPAVAGLVVADGIGHLRHARRPARHGISIGSDHG
jgi:hypothetical protein